MGDLTGSEMLAEVVKAGWVVTLAGHMGAPDVRRHLQEHGDALVATDAVMAPVIVAEAIQDSPLLSSKREALHDIGNTLEEALGRIHAMVMAGVGK